MQPKMLKRINPSQAELGMFIHKLEGPWLKHPFWKSRFVIDDPAKLADLRDAEIEAVVIDLARGRDIVQAARGAPVPAPAPAPQPLASRRHGRLSGEPAAFNPRSTAPHSTAREFGHAGRLAAQSRKVVNKVFLEARLGKTVRADAVEPVIEDIFASIQRNPHAFNGLMRCKRDSEFVYRHALACSALMISLGRQLKLPPSEIREAGLAGLLLDVGVSHLPVDLAASGGDFRRLPAAVFDQHTRLGHDFLHASGLPPQIAAVALQHHERNDGSGYPQGLLGGDIPLLSRMAAICDTYDQLASAGGASQPVDPGWVIQRMAEMTGQFDPAIFAAFVQCIGTFPIGTFVELRSRRLAMVVDQDPADYAHPTVRTFFSLETGERIRAETIDLANCYGADEILALADLSRFEPEDVIELRQRMLALAMKPR